MASAAANMAARSTKLNKVEQFVVDGLVSSWGRALVFYNHLLVAWRARDRAARQKQEKQVELSELKEFMGSPGYASDHVAAYCDPPNLDHPEYVNHMAHVESFKGLEASVEEAEAEEMAQCAVVENTEKELARLVTEEKMHILSFPELLPLAARKAASIYAGKAAVGWLADIERRRQAVYGMEVRDEWSYNEQRDELEYLRDEERQVDDDEYELAAECTAVLLKHATVVRNRRLHALALITRREAGGVAEA